MTLRYWHWLSLAFLALMAARPAAAQSTEMLDMQYGFMGTTLGTPKSEMPKLKRLGRYEKKERYYKPDQELQFQGAELKFVHYLFYKDTLHSIFIRTEGKHNSERMLAALQDLFGEGDRDGYAPRFTWRGNRVILTYDQNLLTGNADIKIISIAEQRRFSEDWRRIGP
jgi:hypothetical protein